MAVAAARLLRGRHYPTTFADFHSWFWSRGLLFHRLMEQAGITTPKPARWASSAANRRTATTRKERELLTPDDIVQADAGGVPLLLRAPSRRRRGGLVIAFDPSPPEGREAFARALPFPSVGAWKAYLGLPLVGYRQPHGGVEEITRRQRSDYLLQLLDPALSDAVRDLAVVVSDLRKRLDLAPDAPLGLFGFSAGGLAALLALADRPIPIAAAVIVGAGPDAEAAVAAAERAFGITYQWTPAARVCAARLDFPARASNIARGTPALLVIRGADDEAVPATGIDRLHAALRPNYIHAPDRLRFETLTGIGHGLDELGKVAALADDWLSEHLTDW